MKRIYVAYVGGTIGMRPGADGYEPAPGHLTGQVRGRPELNEPEVPELTIAEYEPLLDSANMRPVDWLRIARDIAERRDAFDGFVVLHGTDTMAYTASALAFLLRGLGRPVVVTGSQIPLGVLRSDGRRNLLTSVLVAARDDVREVCLVFGSRILRGCRAIKASASGFEAFESPNVAALGSAGVTIEVDGARLRTAAPAPIALPAALDAPVGLLRLYPGMPAALLEAALAAPVRGLVLEAYGAGTVPAADPEVLRVLAEGAARGVVILVVSQCVDGRVDLGAYASSGPLVRAGAVGGLDMTTEAAYAKLVVLLSEGHRADALRELLARDLAGELTP
ncbi:MAG TPA: asparaginase [Solirubrobacter sp.]|nr:asparaginase [Solirubrobacter sp.]